MLLRKIMVAVFIFLVSCQEDEKIISDPVAQFDISKNEGGFYAGSGFVVVNNSLNYDNITWDFGDGTLSSDSVVEHTYKSEGVYSLRLSACNSGSCDEIDLTISVKDSVLNLLAGENSKTWFLKKWTDSNGNEVSFDPCLLCFYSQTFYKNSDPPNYDGEHKWLNNGLLICGSDSLQCNTYGPEQHGWFNLGFNPYYRSNYISIGQAFKVGYDIEVDENNLYLKLHSVNEELHYESVE